jgi:hypothetical protein
MLDFMQGWVWFVCGLGVTVLTAVVLVGVVFVARHAEGRTPHRR